ncbi:MAG: flavin reductase family protein [Gemmatimonadota bacterium]|jgi:flavin reductase (DIM6/NTAB) family NADH-FMN oxidoreductase RutF
MVSEEKFRHVMGHFATGVTILASRNTRGEPVGLTVNAFTSVSLDPPLVLVCVHKEAEAHGSILRSGHFGLSFLTMEQSELALTFAVTEPRERFRGVRFEEGPTGSPLIPGAMAWVDCQVEETFPGGDHSVILGRVLACEAEGGNPLLFFKGSLDLEVGMGGRDS